MKKVYNDSVNENTNYRYKSQTLATRMKFTWTRRKFHDVAAKPTKIIKRMIGRLFDPGTIRTYNICRPCIYINSAPSVPQKLKNSNLL